MNLAPIVLFTYNRPQHTRQTVEALQCNKMAIESDLIIYSDAPKTTKDLQQVINTRDYLKNITGFKQVRLIERKDNFGLANNIIDGVSEVVNEYGSVIVLEDDICTSPYFLDYMNNALAFYRDKSKVMHISGWNYPINADSLPETFLWRVMNCWGWATWADRWQYYKRDTNYLMESFTEDDIYRFNLDGMHNFWGQVIANYYGEINTWAIFWYAAIFKRNGLCLNPAKSLSINIGLDGTGNHCGRGSYSDQQINNKRITHFQGDLIENQEAVESVKKCMKKNRPSFLKRIGGKLRRIIAL